MAYSQAQIQAAALREATMVGGDANASPVIDNAVVLEDMFYLALRESIITGAMSESEAASSKRDYALSVVAGSATLPSTVIEEMLDRSNIYSPTDATIGELSSWQPNYADFIRPVHSIIHYYTVLGDNFLFREAGGAIGAKTATIHLVTVGMPDIPAAITTAMTISNITAERTISILANMLKG